MQLDGYVDRLHGDLSAAAAAGGDAMVETAHRLASSLDAAVRMTLLEALADAAAEITAELAGATVEVRLRGREPELVVTDVAAPSPPLPARAATGDSRDDGDDAGERDYDGTTARITLRLPEALKQRAEDAAVQARQSLNTWLVDAVREAIRPAERGPRSGRGPSQHLSGWVR